MLGYIPEEMLGLNYRAYMSKETSGLMKGIFSKLYQEGKGVSRVDWEMVRRDSARKYMEASVGLMFDNNGKPAGFKGVCRDITERKFAEEEIKKSLREKEILLREVHHRVKNNMQIISSLINLQASRVKDPRINEMFKESRDRIRAMALIHEKLYQSKNLAEINFARYVESLALHLYHIYRVDTNKVRMQQKVEDVFLDINTAIPCGLIINELMSNALKHAFPNNKQGKILLKLHKNKTKHHLVVKDTGVGFPKNFDFRNPESLGMQLINDLVDQIGGTIELESRGGTTFKVSF